MSEAGSPGSTDLGICGCCEGLAVQTPIEVANRPRLSAITYRIGTHPQFKQSLLARLGAVAGLHTRKDDDFSIALLDAWATVADVLTFYQERIANESYLRTASERRSLLELARLIGYKWRPGVAAGAYLAFTIEDAPGAPDQAAKPTTIGAGLRIQGIPGPGEQPQIFETIEQIEARPEWNAMRPRLTQEQPLTTAMQTVFLRGTSTDIRSGDSLLIIADAAGGDRDVKRVVKVTTDAAASTTRVDLVSDPPDPPPLTFPPLQRGVFFTAQHRLTGRVIASNVLNFAWRQADLFALASVQRWSVPALVRNIARQVAHRTFPPESGVFAFRQRAAVFGHNAPRWNSLPAGQRFGERARNSSGTEISVPAAYPDNWDNPGHTLENEQLGRQVDLDRTYPNIIGGSWLVLESPTDRRIYRVEDSTEVSRSDFALSSKVTRLRLDSDDGFATFKLRETAVLAQSERLELADLPILDLIEGTFVTLDAVYPGLRTGQKVILTGTRADLEGVVESEVLTLDDVIFAAGFTTLVFQAALAHSYVGSTVTINANVALATHGETIREVLGGGDASRAFQEFALRQPPLTYVSSDAPSGAASTLELRVNDLLWHEVQSFFGRGPADRVFVTRTGDDGNTAVQFGDGIRGARPPTGLENIQATYRKGIGSQGNVPAGQLSLLLARPMGVRGVTNPLAASGAADPEARDEVRRNAPLTVLTMDRIVSLQDYEDFARAFAGIAKALATWTWSGQARGVFITVAGPNGADIGADSRTCANLLAAIAKAGDPHVPVRVQSYRRAFFRLAATVTVDPDAHKERVLAQVEAALRAHFSFDARAFGQPVSLSEVMAVLQSVAGVTAVDVDEFVRTDGIGGNGLEQPLPAAFPQASGDAALTPAELLILDPRPIELVGAAA